MGRRPVFLLCHTWLKPFWPWQKDRKLGIWDVAVAEIDIREAGNVVHEQVHRYAHICQPRAQTWWKYLTDLLGLKWCTDVVLEWDNSLMFRDSDWYFYSAFASYIHFSGIFQPRSVCTHCKAVENRTDHCTTLSSWVFVNLMNQVVSYHSLDFSKK